MFISHIRNHYPDVQLCIDVWEVRMHADSLHDCGQVSTLISVIYNYVAFYHSHHWNLCLQLMCLYSQVLGLEMASPCHRERGAMVKLSSVWLSCFLKLFQSAVLDFSYNILALYTAWWVAHCSLLSHYTIHAYPEMCRFFYFAFLSSRVASLMLLQQ